MLADTHAKNLLTKLGTTEKVLLVLYLCAAPASVDLIRKKLISLGVPSAKKWNISSVLAKCKSYAIRTPDGWELTDEGTDHVEAESSIKKASAPLFKAAVSLRNHLVLISNPDERAFAEDAIRCIEAGLLKPAIVFSWVGAVSLLHEHVVKHHLSAFNAEAAARDPKWRAAKDADGLGLMKESNFLDVLVAIKVIGKSVKAELKVCLDLRNSCGHPNSLKIGEAKVWSHVETLVLNVFSKF